MMFHRLLIEPHYLPATAYFKRIYQIDHLELEVQGYYQKQTFQNRCYLATRQGLQKLMIPIQRSTRRGRYCDLKIDYSMSWALQHTRAIRTAYGTTPYYGTLEDLIFPILLRKPTFLLDVTLPIIMACFTFLRLDKKVTQTTIYCDQGAADVEDLRGRFQPQKDAVPVEAALTSPNLTVLHLLATEGPYAHDYFVQPLD